MSFNRQDAIDVARQLCYHFFATALSDPRSEGWKNMHDRDYRTHVSAAAAFLRHEAAALGGELASGERAPTTMGLEDALELVAESFDCIAPEHKRIFGFLLSKDCPPYESEYCPQTFSIYRSQRIGDVAGYYKAFGLEPSRSVPERHDHVSLAMEFMAWAIGKERHARQRGDAASEGHIEVCREAQVTFFRDHLCWWVPAFALALHRKAEGLEAHAEPVAEPRTFYGRVAVALAAFVAFERLYRGIKPPSELVAPKPLEDSAEMTCGGCEMATAR
jgi:TorA maturation chaperone TorD